MAQRLAFGWPTAQPVGGPTPSVRVAQPVGGPKPSLRVAQRPACGWPQTQPEGGPRLSLWADDSLENRASGGVNVGCPLSMRREEWFRLHGDILPPNDGRQLQLENQSGVSRIHRSTYTHGASAEPISESHS